MNVSLNEKKHLSIISKAYSLIDISIHIHQKIIVMKINLILQSLVYVSLSMAANSEVLVMLKTNTYTDPEYAKPIVYDSIFSDPKAPIMKVSIGVTDRNISKALVAGYIYLVPLPERIFTKDEVADLKRTQKRFVDFRKKFPQSSKLIDPYISLYQESVERIEQGDRRFSGKWASKEDYDPTIKTLDNRAFPRSKVSSKNLEGIRVVTTSGIEMIGWDKLTEDAKQKLGLKQLQEKAIEKRKDAERRIARMHKNFTELGVSKKESIRSRDKIKETLTLYAELNKEKVERESGSGGVGFTTSDIKKIFGEPDEVGVTKYDNYTDRLVEYRYKNYLDSPDLGDKEDLRMIFSLRSGFLDGVGLRGSNNISQRVFIEFPE